MKLGPSSDYGASGIPRQGKEVEYATALWCECPSAFWLHPEGPLSDTTPDEYLATLPEPTSLGEPAMSWLACYAAQGMAQSGAAMSPYNAQIFAAHAQWRAYANTRNLSSGLYVRVANSVLGHLV